MAAATLLFCGPSAFALGLGNIGVQSALGQPLHASIALLGADSGELTGSCIKVRVESLDGVALLTPQLAITRSGLSSFITLTSRQAIHEPAATIVAEAGCAAPVRRSYQVLFDLPAFSASASPELVPARESGAISGPASAKVQPEAPVRKKSAARVANPVRIQSRQTPESAAKKTATPKPSASVNPAGGQGAALDVLRLSGNDDDAVSRLKLSSALSLPENAAPQPQSEEARLAQREFAALLNGVDPRAGIDAERKARQAQEAALRTQMAALQRQNSANQIALAASQAGSSLVFWLTGLLALCLLAIGWLAWRLRSLARSDKAAWWKTGRPDDEDAAQFVASEPAVPGQSPVGSAAAQPAAGSVACLPQSLDADIGAAAPSAPDAGAGLALPENAGSMHGLVPQPDHGASAGKAGQRGRSDEFKVEEISDVTQEAEFWISLNNQQRAIEILEPYTQSPQPDSPVPWLYLLDLYSEIRDAEKYNALRERFIHLFNARIPLYGEPELQAQTLEDFPHLLARICTLWQSSDIVPFLQSLLIDDREGERAGFDLPLYRDILMLIGIAHEKKRLHQLDEPHSGIREAASGAGGEVPLPTIETITHAAPMFTPDGDINFAPIDFNLDIASEQKTG
ncbi:FimV family protein [Herminiimonas sp. CN]|uniref:type IV pilus assembly protein FimV n=1 Tax=Herminiimonas sp. CN TaxID=1349818 RepID=UPI0004735036|nr:hypothetical protein [Herminiimonas sp. CN]